MSLDSPPSILEDISTYWPLIHNPLQFVLRYAPAIRRYVGAVVHNPHDAEEVAQEFLARILEKGFHPGRISRGRFRDYLKASVRYVAISHLRRRRPAELDDAALAALAQPAADVADDCWNDEWRQCLLDRVWQALELHQQRTPGNLYYTVLRQLADHPTADYETHAARVSEKIGTPYRADACRQQVRRARRHFAELIIAEIRRTLHEPTAETIEQELFDLGLMDYVRTYLPPDWRTREQF